MNQSNNAAWSAPTVTCYGTIEEMTLQNTNKVGGSTDAISAVNPNLIGSIVNVP